MTASPDVGSTEQSNCYVYGIVPASAAASSSFDDAAGAGQSTPRRIEVLTYREIAAVVERVDVSRPFGKRADLVAHSDVLNSIAAEGPVVPIRFGTVISQDSDVVEELLEPNYEYFTGLLEQLRGHAQFTLRARYVEEAILTEVVAESPHIAELSVQTRGQPDDATYGDRVRLGELVAEAVDIKRVVDAEEILAPLVPLSVAHRVTMGSGLEQIVDSSFLVADTERTEFEDAAEAVAERMHERVTLKLLGPLAAFDFVGQE